MPVMSDGIRSGVNWMRLNFSDSSWAMLEIIKRLGQAGHAFEDAVALAEQGDQHLLEHLVLADDDAAEVLRHALVDLGQVLGGARSASSTAGLALGPADTAAFGFMVALKAGGSGKRFR